MVQYLCRLHDLLFILMSFETTLIRVIIKMFSLWQKIPRKKGIF